MAARRSKGSGAPRGAFGLVATCFALSGFAGLLYETTWVRRFAIDFGTTDVAVGLVLAAYMAGLGAGAAVGARLAPRIRRPVWVYGLLELGIAGTALLVPFASTLLRGLFASIYGDQPVPPDAAGWAQPVFYFGGAFLLLLVPTLLMGMTLPLLARHAVERDDQVGRRVGALYALNTGGAVFGTLAAAFGLLPFLGIIGTTLVGVGVNLVVFLIAVRISRDGRDRVVEVRHGDAAPQPEAWRRESWVLPLMLVSGAVAFIYEVLWTRLLSHVLGGSHTAFATMLASFLAGIAMGSAVAARLARTPRHAVVGLVVSWVGVAALSMLIYAVLDYAPTLSLEASEHSSLGKHVLLAFLVLFPASFCIGATFPFAVRLLTRGEEQAGPVSGQVFAWNTFGAIAGALLAVFVIIPGLGFGNTLRLAVGLNFLLAMVATGLRGVSPRLFLGVLTLACLSQVLFVPGSLQKLLLISPFSARTTDGRIAYLGVGRSATVVLVEHNGSFELRANGLPQASIERPGYPVLRPQRLLTALPLVARPRAESLLVIGLGGGVMLEDVPESVTEIHAVEIEPEVVTANEVIASQRAVDPLAERGGRLRLIVNDARSALALTDKRYDVVVSQPSHPWTSAASFLYTREFFQEVERHLEPDGVFVQWFSTNFIDDEILRCLGATLLEAFPHVRVYRPYASMLMLLSSNAPLDLERSLGESGVKEMLADHYPWVGIADVEDLAMMLVLDSATLETLARDTPVNTDNRNYISYLTQAVMRNPLRVGKVEALFASHDPLSAARSSDLPDLDRGYVAYRCAQSAFHDRARRILRSTTDEYQRAIAEARIHELQGQTFEAREAARRALAVRRQDPDARFLMIGPSWQFRTGGARRTSGLPDPWGAVVEGCSGSLAELRALDDRLALARPRHACFRLAVELRCRWRLEGSRAHERVALASEALEIIDRALPFASGLQQYQIRFRAATRAGRTADILGTAHAIAGILEVLERVPDLPPSQRRSLRDRTRTLLRHVGTVSDPHYREQVVALSVRLEDLMRE